MIFSSMTSTLTHSYADAKVLQLVQASETRFAFSCLEQHVFRGADLGPYELSWLDDNHVYNDDASVKIAELSSEVQEFWGVFKEALSLANREGRIWWGVGRGESGGEQNSLYPDRSTGYMQETLAQLHQDGHEIFGYTPVPALTY